MNMLELLGQHMMMLERGQHTMGLLELLGQHKMGLLELLGQHKMGLMLLVLNKLTLLLLK